MSPKNKEKDKQKDKQRDEERLTPPDREKYAKIHLCYVCGRKFNSENKLKEHLLREHGISVEDSV